MKKYLFIFVLYFGFSSFLFSKQKIGLVLSGGGAKSFAQIGVLKIIDSLQIPIDQIAGASMGAFVGALYSIGYTGKEIEKIFTSDSWSKYFDETIKREDVYVGQKRWSHQSLYKFYTNTDGKFGLPTGQIAGTHIINKFFELTQPYIKTKKFSDFPINFFCVASEIETSKIKVFNSGNLHEALRASISYPLIFHPFELDEKSYLDGGILDNLPVNTLKKNGSNFIIGINSWYSSKKEDKTFLDVINRAFSMSIDKNVDLTKKDINIYIQIDNPHLTTFDFSKVEKTIVLGELAARENLLELAKLSDPKRYQEIRKKKAIKKVIYLINDISVIGNQKISSSKIKEYSELKKRKRYSYLEISNAMKKIWNSELFQYVYPIIDSTHLTIVVKEKANSQIDILGKYNNNDEASLRILYRTNNSILKNSALLLGLQVGDRKELNLDYIKNFGEHFGVYYRVYNYLKQQTFYKYNEENFRRTSSEKIFEYGNTFGIGIFYYLGFILEAYFYHFYTSSKDDISYQAIDKKLFRSNGLGIKLYNETLDDDIFPMRGSRLLTKYHSTTSFLTSDSEYKKFVFKYKKLAPINGVLSGKFKFEYGTFFEDNFVPYDPFYIGGINSFLGYNDREYASSVFKIYTAGIRKKFKKNYYFDVIYNLADLRNYDEWSIKNINEINFEKGFGIQLGKKIFRTSIKGVYSYNLDKKKSYFYLSIGNNDLDPFEFSKK